MKSFGDKIEKAPVAVATKYCVPPMTEKRENICLYDAQPAEPNSTASVAYVAMQNRHEALCMLAYDVDRISCHML